MNHSVSLELILFREMEAGNHIDTEKRSYRIKDEIYYRIDPIEAFIARVMKSAVKLTERIDNPSILSLLNSL